MTCNFKVNQIPGGIHLEYNTTMDEKPINQFIHVFNTDVKICRPDNKCITYSIETGDKVSKVHHFEPVVEYYYVNNDIGCRFKVKPEMCNPRVDSFNSKPRAVLFSNKLDYEIYAILPDGLNGTFTDMIDGTKLDIEYAMDMVYRFEYHGTYSLLYSNPEDETVIIYDHINKITREFVCGGWQLFEYITTTTNGNIGQDLYIYISENNKCDLITVDIDDPSNFKVVNNVHNFGSNNMGRYFITTINDKKVLIAIDGYHVEIRDFTSELTLIKSFNLTYMQKVYEIYDSGIPNTDFTNTYGSESFINVKNGKLYYDNSDGILEPLDDSISKKEFMAIDLNKINDLGEYIPIPLFDCISDEHQELITTYYDDQPIIELTILDNKYILEFPDKKFIIVDMR
jgi:hypothetical protein